MFQTDVEIYSDSLKEVKCLLVATTDYQRHLE